MTNINELSKEDIEANALIMAQIEAIKNKNVAKKTRGSSGSTFDKIADIIEHMEEGLKLLKAVKSTDSDEVIVDTLMSQGHDLEFHNLAPVVKKVTERRVAEQKAIDEKKIADLLANLKK